MIERVRKDIKLTKSFARAALFLTWSDTKARYRRSVLGPFWLVLGTGIGVAGLGIVWSILLKTERATFIPSLTVGLIVWQLIASSIIESSTIFVKNSMVVRNIRTPFLFFPIQLLMRQLISFAHNFLIIFVVLFIYPPPLSFVQLMAIPGLIILTGNLLWIAVLIGLFGARFRDLEFLINAIMPLLFFLSPVIYRPTQLEAFEQIAWLNPFTYFITLIRDPIQGVMPSLYVYGVSIVMLFLGWVITFWILERKYTRLAFWL